MDRDTIRKIVRDVLAAEAQRPEAASRPAASKGYQPRRGPTVLNVFHAGVRRLEEALKQVQLIEEMAGRSSVYTVESARAWVCGGDVREGAGVKCILDTVKPTGLDKVLQRADVLVLPTFCLQTAAKVAGLICDDQGSKLVGKIPSATNSSSVSGSTTMAAMFSPLSIRLQYPTWGTPL